MDRGRPRIVESGRDDLPSLAQDDLTMSRRRFEYPLSALFWLTMCAAVIVALLARLTRNQRLERATRAEFMDRGATFVSLQDGADLSLLYTGR